VEGPAVFSVVSPREDQKPERDQGLALISSAYDPIVLVDLEENNHEREQRE
jgi:hypothetical protein